MLPGMTIVEVPIPFRINRPSVKFAPMFISGDSSAGIESRCRCIGCASAVMLMMSHRSVPPTWEVRKILGPELTNPGICVLLDGLVPAHSVLFRISAVDLRHLQPRPASTFCTCDVHTGGNSSMPSASLTMGAGCWPPPECDPVASMG